MKYAAVGPFCQLGYVYYRLVENCVATYIVKALLGVLGVQLYIYIMSFPKDRWTIKATGVSDVLYLTSL